MKKGMLSVILAAGTTLNVLAGGPTELNRQLVSQQGAITEYGECGSVVLGERSLESKEGYVVKVRATEEKGYDFYKLADSRDLKFTISTPKTRMYITDKGANGLDKGDYLLLDHKFENGDSLNMYISYCGADDFFRVRSAIYSADNGREENCYSYSDVDTSALNFAPRKMVAQKMKPVFELGKSIYSNLVSCVESNTNPSIPFKDLETALSRVEPLLPRIKNQDSSVGLPLIRIANEYSQLAKERL